MLMALAFFLMTTGAATPTLNLIAVAMRCRYDSIAKVGRNAHLCF